MQSELINYVGRQRWCGFKNELHNVSEIEMEYIPFDWGKRRLVLGTAKFNNGTERKFFMPLSSTPVEGLDTVVIDGKKYHDALQDNDYWPALMSLFEKYDNKVAFGNGVTISYERIGTDDSADEYAQAHSQPLNVEQSNTTIMVGDRALAFKQERMIECSFLTNPELEMNAKLVEAGATVMPHTYGAFLMHTPEGKTAMLGIVQDFVINRGDLWEYANEYLLEALKKAEAEGKQKLDPEEHPEFIAMMEKLGKKTMEMGRCLSMPNGTSEFEPELVSGNYLTTYRQNMTELLQQTKEMIEGNFDKIDEKEHASVRQLLNSWDDVSQRFVDKQIRKLSSGEYRGRLVRAHGDFHLGQVLVTEKNDLKFIDFGGEPALPFEQRRMKYPETRDVAGMYRSISGYLGPVVAESFAATGETTKRANGSERNVTNPLKEQWAQNALKPMIEKMTESFMLQADKEHPMLALEILRKNLYEVKYEAENRPDMVRIPLKGLVDLFDKKEERRAVNDNQMNMMINKINSGR